LVLWSWTTQHSGNADRRAIRGALSEHGDRLFAGGFRVVEANSGFEGSTFELDLGSVSFRLPGEAHQWEVKPGFATKVQQTGTVLVVAPPVHLQTTPALND
jgi:hypothetical protein